MVVGGKSKNVRPDRYELHRDRETANKQARRAARTVCNKKLNVFDVFENCKNIRNDLFHFYYESGDL